MSKILQNIFDDVKDENSEQATFTRRMTHNVTSNRILCVKKIMHVDYLDLLPILFLSDRNAEKLCTF